MTTTSPALTASIGREVHHLKGQELGYEITSLDESDIARAREMEYHCCQVGGLAVTD